MMKKIGIYMGICILLISVYGCSSSDETTSTSKNMVAYNALNEEEQSLTISPSNSTVEKISVKDIPKSQLDESYDRKKVYAVTFSDTANTKHGDLVVYLDESGKKVLGKGFK